MFPSKTFRNAVKVLSSFRLVCAFSANRSGSATPPSKGGAPYPRRYCRGVLVGYAGGAVEKEKECPSR